jgi:pimeloyl-ACP methyl ester carboxylesterase
MAEIRTTTRSNRTSWPLMLLAAGLVALATLFALPSSARPAGAAKADAPKPTIVLVHGAWADASGWNEVIKKLQGDGYPVIAPANPLRSLSGDAAYIASVLAQTPGPLVVVGHSYGGAVITNAAAGNDKVNALVYIDAFIPDVGENILQLTGAGSLVPTAIEFKAFPPPNPNDVDIYLKQDMFRQVFAGDVAKKAAAVMAAAQRPLAAAAGAEPTQAAAWKTIRSWALIGTEDKTITPDSQRSMAERAGSVVEEVKASHVSMISRPNAVTELIETAAEATAGED